MIFGLASTLAKKKGRTLRPAFSPVSFETFKSTAIYLCVSVIVPMFVVFPAVTAMFVRVVSR
jgi:hypothetical protein